jgi:hypothetical protein
VGIDFVIDYACIPKEALSTMGILARLKARDRAARIIKLYRDSGDMRPPAEMGFELARRTPDGEEETQVVIVQSLLDDAAPLDTFAPHCVECPANRTGAPYGCLGNVNYPITKQAEFWLLKRLPIAEEPLPFLLLREVISENRELAQQAAQIRATSDSIFESKEVFGRVVEGITATTNHLFGLMFLGSAVTPVQNVMLMLFFGAIRRDMEADELRALNPAPPDFQERFPFLIAPAEDDDRCLSEIKDFLEALYIAWGLDVSVSLDA